MTVLLDLKIPNTLDALVERLEMSLPGVSVEAWVFEDYSARASAEGRLLSHGVNARFRSAYKPLLHYFLEETEENALAVDIAVPDHPAASAARWRLEAYPLAGLLGEISLSFSQGSAALDYVLRIDGTIETVFAPNRPRLDALGQTQLAPCGWLRITDADGDVIEDGPLETEYEQVFAAAIACVADGAWPERPPFFQTLLIEASIPSIERPLDYGDEVVSTVEALHEDLYFSILELLKHRAGLGAADRTLQPGQIVPDIRQGSGPALLRISLREGLDDLTQPGPTDLEDADRPLEPEQIEQALAALGGEAFEFPSVEGRRVGGTIIDGLGASILISSGQHANETASVVGGLRAMRRLVAEDAGRIAFIPMDNPDGHALHHRLRATNPRHMLHAARYTALGDDLESRTVEPFFEKAARLDAIHRSGARLHINLHGYPSHEWTRPFSGYLPRGFELWSIPKGFFLILRHRPGLAAQADAFIRALAAKLAEDPLLVAFNETQLAVWQAHAGEMPFPVYDSIPCMVTEAPAQLVDFQLITEYPDETIYGEDFRLAHTTQMRTVLAAVALYRGLSSD